MSVGGRNETPIAVTKTIYEKCLPYKSFSGGNSTLNDFSCEDHEQ